MSQQPKTSTITFPLGMLNRRLAVQSQPPYTTPLCLNVWGDEVGSARARGGTRPPCRSLGAIGGSSVYNWCRGSYYSSGTHVGIGVTTSGGSVFSLDGVDWTTSTVGTGGSAPGTLAFPLMASCAVMGGVFFQACNATSSTPCTQHVMPAGASGNLSNAGGGTAPLGYGIILHHQDRLWLFNRTTDPHTIIASAVGDPTNWDTDDPTEGAAYTNSGPEGGVLFEPVIAAISHGQFLYFGGPTSIYVVAGNPNVSGVRKLPCTIGPVTHTAWCTSPDGWLYVITPDGLCRIPPGGGVPEQISRKIIPNELMGLNGYLGDKVCIGYDERWQGLVIGVDHHSGSTYDTQWWFKLPDGEFPGSFSPMALPAVMHVIATFPELISDDKSSVIPIALNATAYQFDRTYISSVTPLDFETFDSYIVLGPFFCGDGSSEGMLQALAASLAEGSGDCNWEIYTGDSAESAYQSMDPPSRGYVGTFAAKTPHFTGQKWTQERLNFWQHPRCRGYCFYIKIFDVNNTRWIVEDIIMRRLTLGLRRGRI